MPPLEDLVGHHLMIGFQGSVLTPEIIRTFRITRAAGLIVFRPNFESAAAFTRLLSELEEAIGRQLIVAVDHEGGRVIHLSEGITVFPDNLAVASGSGKADIQHQGEIEGRELRRLGFDLNLAPTVDVLAGKYSPNIGIRSYGSDAETVAALGAARIQGMQSQSLSACAKHFPGLGSAPVDPHLALPQLSADWDEMWRIHLKPFQAAIAAGVHAVMSSHPVYTLLEPGALPATFSRRLISGLLRKELKFQGLILSDDLEMGALERFGAIGERAVRAVAAGHDMVLVCHQLDGQLQAFEALMQAYQTGRLRAEDLEASAERVAQMRQRRQTRFSGGEPACEKDGAELALKMARQGTGGPGFGSVRPAGRPGVIFPRLSDLSSRFFIEGSMRDEKEFIEKTFDQAGRGAGQILVTGLQISRDEWSQAQALARASDWTLFFCYDAHQDPGARRLLEQLEKELAGRLAVVFLRNPYDQEYLGPATAFVQAYGFRAAQITAAAGRLLRSYPEGK